MAANSSVTPEPVGNAREMISRMEPALQPGEFVFCSTTDPAIFAAAFPEAMASLREAEGVSLVLPRGAAERFGFGDGMPIRCITLMVFSALDGVGLTAAVASALAAQGIPCNMMAGFHHDHIFVPSGMEDRAIAALRTLQRDADRV